MGKVVRCKGTSLTTNQLCSAIPNGLHPLALIILNPSVKLLPHNPNCAFPLQTLRKPLLLSWETCQGGSDSCSSRLASQVLLSEPQWTFTWEASGQPLQISLLCAEDDTSRCRSQAGSKLVVKREIQAKRPGECQALSFWG